jgi:hypothetical protein
MKAVALNLAAAHNVDSCRTFYRTVVGPYETGMVSANTQTRRIDPGAERELFSDADRMEQMFVEVVKASAGKIPSLDDQP